MQAFEKSYVAAFTRTPPTSLVELINIRVSASVETSDRTPLMAPAGSGTASAIKEHALPISPSSAITGPHGLRPLRADGGPSL